MIASIYGQVVHHCSMHNTLFANNQDNVDAAVLCPWVFSKYVGHFGKPVETLLQLFFVSKCSDAGCHPVLLTHQERCC